MGPRHAWLVKINVNTAGMTVISVVYVLNLVCIVLYSFCGVMKHMYLEVVMRNYTRHDTARILALNDRLAPGYRWR